MLLFFTLTTNTTQFKDSSSDICFDNLPFRAVCNFNVGTKISRVDVVTRGRRRVPRGCRFSRSRPWTAWLSKTRITRQFVQCVGVCHIHIGVNNTAFGA